MCGWSPRRSTDSEELAVPGNHRRLPGWGRGWPGAAAWEDRHPEPCRRLKRMVPAFQGWGLLWGECECEVTGCGPVPLLDGLSWVGEEGFHHAAGVFSAHCLDILIKQPFTRLANK